ncbi:MAG: class I SAM-dependent methyltransferase [Puniceicoccaceae bacterium]
MNSEKISEEYWSKIPHENLPHFASKEKTQAEVAFLKKYLPVNSRVLDLGCGWGRVAAALAYEGYSVRGIDLSPHLVELARKNAPQELKISYSTGSLLDIPCRDSSFDCVVCLWGTFNHLLSPDEQLTGLNEIFRVLCLGGVAILEMSNGESKANRINRQKLGFGHQNRVFELRYKPKSPPNTIYIHDRKTLDGLGHASDFLDYSVGFKTIFGKRRLVAFLKK